MGLIQLYSTTKTSTTSSDISSNWQEKNAAFCNCSRNVSDDKQCCNTRRSSESSIPLDICRCGEGTCKTLNWLWDKELKQPQTLFIGETVSFHPCYSQGSSVVRGECELAKDQIHYWEIKIVHWFSGTDLVCIFDLQQLLVKCANNAQILITNREKTICVWIWWVNSNVIFVGQKETYVFYASAPYYYHLHSCKTRKETSLVSRRT